MTIGWLGGHWTDLINIQTKLHLPNLGFGAPCQMVKWW